MSSLAGAEWSGCRQLVVPVPPNESSGEPALSRITYLPGPWLGTVFQSTYSVAPATCGQLESTSPGMTALAQVVSVTPPVVRLALPVLAELGLLSRSSICRPRLAPMKPLIGVGCS